MLGFFFFSFSLPWNKKKFSGVNVRLFIHFVRGFFFFCSGLSAVKNWRLNVFPSGEKRVFSWNIYGICYINVHFYVFLACWNKLFIEIIISTDVLFLLFSSFNICWYWTFFYNLCLSNLFFIFPNINFFSFFFFFLQSNDRFDVLFTSYAPMITCWKCLVFYNLKFNLKHFVTKTHYWQKVYVI